MAYAGLPLKGIAIHERSPVVEIAPGPRPQ
jgi:hypothetical protein